MDRGRDGEGPGPSGTRLAPDVRRASAARRVPGALSGQTSAGVAPTAVVSSIQIHSSNCIGSDAWK